MTGLWAPKCVSETQPCLRLKRAFSRSDFSKSIAWLEIVKKSWRLKSRSRSSLCLIDGDAIQTLFRRRKIYTFLCLFLFAVSVIQILSSWLMSTSKNAKSTTLTKRRQNFPLLFAFDDNSSCLENLRRADAFVRYNQQIYGLFVLFFSVLVPCRPSWAI